MINSLIDILQNSPTICASIVLIRRIFRNFIIFLIPIGVNFNKKALITHQGFFGVDNRFLPLNKGKANKVCEGNSLKKGNVAKRQKDGCSAKDGAVLTGEPRRNTTLCQQFLSKLHDFLFGCSSSRKFLRQLA